MSQFINSEYHLQCPYDDHHWMLRNHFSRHLMKCARNHPHVVLEHCPHNYAHTYRAERREEHLANCDSIGLEDPIAAIMGSTSNLAAVNPTPRPQPQLPSATNSDDEDWDNDNYRTYDPQRYAASARVIRQTPSGTRSERRQFRENETLRWSQLEHGSRNRPTTSNQFTARQQTVVCPDTKKTTKFVKSGFEKKNITSKPFYLLMAEYFYRTDENRYSPAEIAIGKFSFKDGPIDIYHEFVKSECIRRGYEDQAVARSFTHKIPFPYTPEEMGETQYHIIYERLLAVLGLQSNDSKTKKPLVFAPKKHLEMLRSVLKQISASDWTKRFHLLPLELLFNTMKAAISDDNSIGDIDQILYNDVLSGENLIACEFHLPKEEAGCCPKSHIRRWFFYFEEQFGKALKLFLVRGIHLPPTPTI